MEIEIDGFTAGAVIRAINVEINRLLKTPGQSAQRDVDALRKLAKKLYQVPMS